MRIIEILKDRITGKAPKGAKRNPRWHKLQQVIIAEHPYCSCCESTTKLRVHHIIPFWLAPWLEMKKKNLVVLCENKKYGINCHLLIGHLGRWAWVNPNCEIDIVTWNMKLKAK